MMRQIFNEIIKQKKKFTPEAWRRVRIKVIHKNGDVEDVGNLSPDLLSACAVETVYDSTVQQIISQT